MKTTVKQLQKIISESIKRQLLREDSGYLPAGAEYDPRAPYNEVTRDKDYDKFEKEYPTYKFVVAMLASNSEDDITTINTLGEELRYGGPAKVKLTAAFSYDQAWEEPDEDGLSFSYHANEEFEEFYVDLYHSEWFNALEERNPGLHKLLKDNFESTKDYLMSECNNTDELKKELNEMGL